MDFKTKYIRHSLSRGNACNMSIALVVGMLVIYQKSCSLIDIFWYFH